MKKMKMYIIMALVLALMWTAETQATGKITPYGSASSGNIPADLSMEVTVDEAPVFYYGETKTIRMSVTFYDHSMDKGISNVKFRPVTDNDPVTYPFEIKNREELIAENLADGGSASKDLSFTARHDVLSGYRTIPYEISFRYEGKEYLYSDSFSVNINGNPDLDSSGSTKEAAAADPSEKNDIKISLGVNQSTPVCVYGKPVAVTLTLLNNGGNTANGVVITPLVDVDSNAFPFEIQQMDYSKNLETLIGTGWQKDPAARMKTVTYSFVTRKEITSGYKKVSFRIDYYTDALIDKSITKDIYVMVQGNPEMDAVDGTGDGEKKNSVPRVIVSGYTTVPEEILAGDSFQITMSMTNTSRQTAVSNMVFDIQSENFAIDTNSTAAAFLPVSGSSSVFVDRIGPEETKEISIEMTARSDLSPRPYVLNVKMNYEDAQKTSYESTASVSIPVKQKDKLEISTPEVMPESVNVGDQANVMFNIYNTGKTQLYNVMVRFQGDSIADTECFVGNVAAGATGSVDAMLTGMAVTMDEGVLVAEITYENQSGEMMTVEKEYHLYVSDFMPGDETFGGDFADMEEDGTPESGRLPLIAGGIVAVLAVVGAAAFFIVKKKKAKALALLESEDIDETE